MSFPDSRIHMGTPKPEGVDETWDHLETIHGYQAFEQELKRLGFESSAEFHRLVASVDLSTNACIIAFRRWQYQDGSKDGLVKLATRAAGDAGAAENAT